jgi:uncharacterized protein YggT (Ycf19 family)
MSLIDLILNLAALLLWISWRNLPFDPTSRLRPATLTGTLRRAEPSRVKRWHFLAALVGLLAIRALFYTWVGGSLGWVPAIKLGTVSLAFRSDLFWTRMLPFSIGSFLHTLVMFYAWLLLFSFTPSSPSESSPGLRFVRLHLGSLIHWPRWLRAILPFLFTGFGWLALSPLLQYCGVIPPATSWSHRLQQAVVIGAGSYLLWKMAIVWVLGLHLLDTHVYLGAHPIWNFVNTVGRWLLQPLRPLPLRVGRMDFAPVVAIALVFALSLLLEHKRFGLPALYQHLPF